MIFTETSLKGAYIVEPALLKDRRGLFARSFCREEFFHHRLNPNVVQCNLSFNKGMGTLRGMHYQDHPHGECKLVRCTMGAAYDVIIDLRSTSPTYCQWYATKLESRSRKMLYIPEGFAHGFMTLEDNTEIFYQMSESYYPQYARGIRWNDPAFDIDWPFPNPIISEKDENYPDFNGAAY